jgi:hypothetical protein
MLDGALDWLEGTEAVAIGPLGPVQRRLARWVTGLEPAPSR